jgi:signal transduction histidine kinase
MSVPRSLSRTAVFAVLYVLATFAGRLTVMDGTNLSMVWPAAGVAVVWFCAQRQASARWADVVALAVITLVVNLATGATAAMSLVFVLANLVQVGVLLYLFRRWRPALWGTGGSDGLSSPRDLWGLLAAAFCATAAGAAIGPTGMWLLSGHYSWPSTAVWLARNTASILLISAAGLRFGHAVTVRRRRHGGPGGWPRQALSALAATPPWRLAEYAAVAVCSLAAYLIGFAYADGLPLSFPLIALTVWAAIRLSTSFVVLHDLAVGAIAVLFTLHRDGPFAAIDSHPLRALIVQLFVALVAVVGLALALGRDERAALAAELAADRAALAAQREEAARRADLMTAIIDSMADGLSVVDAHGQVTLRNPAAVGLLGGRISSAVAAAQHYGLLTLDGRPLPDSELPYARVMAGHRDGMDILIRNPGVPDGRIVNVRGTTLPDACGDRSAVLLYHDVTAERRHRDELAGFAGVVAHDLLNPLSAVEGWTQAAREILLEDPAHGAAEAADSLRRVSRAAVRMRHLINDLLAYTTARDAAIVTEPVSLADVIADITAARTDAAVAANAPVPRFTVGDLPTVHADLVLIRQLLDNLIGNAIKYIAPGVVPEVTVGSAPAGTGMAAITITDNGIGIPAGQHAAIFDNFHRAHRDAGYAGTGLGLAICKRIVERHAGTISATDNPGGGSSFTVTLPSAAGSAAAVTAEAPAGPPLTISGPSR